MVAAKLAHVDKLQNMEHTVSRLKLIEGVARPELIYKSETGYALKNLKYFRLLYLK